MGWGGRKMLNSRQPCVQEPFAVQPQYEGLWKEQARAGAAVILCFGKKVL